MRRFQIRRPADHLYGEGCMLSSGIVAYRFVGGGSGLLLSIADLEDHFPGIAISWMDPEG
jgi:hypothetical protein